VPGRLIYFIISVTYAAGITSCGEGKDNNSKSVSGKPESSTLTSLKAQIPHHAGDSIAMPLKGPSRSDSTAGKQYQHWQSFWKEFKKAIAKRDSSRIMQLTSFPFLQNASFNNEETFKANFMGQVFEVGKHTPVFFGEWTFPGENEAGEAMVTSYDTVYYMHSAMKDFYFAKVSGNYKLVCIITPG
jgi:hypothetical protein